MAASPLLSIALALATSPGVDLGRASADPDQWSLAPGAELALERPLPSTPDRSPSALGGAIPMMIRGGRLRRARLEALESRQLSAVFAPTRSGWSGGLRFRF